MFKNAGLDLWKPPVKRPFDKEGNLDLRTFPPRAVPNRADLKAIDDTNPAKVLARGWQAVTGVIWNQKDQERFERGETGARREMGPVPPNAWNNETNQIVEETPGVSGELWLAMVAGLRAGPTIPVELRPISTGGRAAQIYERIISAVKNAVRVGEKGAEVTEFLKQGNVAVGRVKVGGKVRVYVGVKVPKGSLGAVDATGKPVTFYPTKEVGDWLRENVLLPGEELADVTASSAHAEDAVKTAILRDAEAAKIDPRTVEGSIGAATPVCQNCQATWANELPRVVPDNPAEVQK